jgi:hypothetical protein
MPTFNVKASVRDGEMWIQVDHGLTGAGHPHLFVRASSSAAPALPQPGAWPAGLPWSIADRLRNGGDEKGRVLSVWQELPGRQPVPLTVLAWHAHGAGPLYVFDAAHSPALSREVGRELTAVLLDVLLEAAAHRNAPVANEWRRRLRWSQVALKHAPHRERSALRKANLQRALALHFTKHQPPPTAAAWTKGAWLGERAF